jgi:DNA mismatch repair protein MLH1
MISPIHSSKLTGPKVEDLFYNVPTRRRAFRSASEEYAKILDVVGRYAVHCSGVAFSCRKHGDSGVSISTPASASIVDRIRQIHGSAVANEVVEFKAEDTKFGFRASGYATNANYHVKKTVILLFINHRAVESTAVKRAVEQTYSSFLPKGGHPFVYLDLEIEPNRVDVNVHPTKREVNFLNEDEIIELICTEIRSKLAEVDSSRTFLTQSLLPGMQTIETLQREQETSTTEDTAEASKGVATPKTPAPTKKPYENNLVRTDSKVRKITAMLAPAISSPNEPTNPDLPPNSANQPTSLDTTLQYTTTNRLPLKIALSSIKSLRATVRSEMHTTLTETFAAHTYVGLVDSRRRLAAIQSGVKLYLIDYGLTCTEFFYQIGLTDFGNFGVIRLDPAPKLVDLLKIGADAERQEHSSADADEAESIFANAPEMIAETLIARREMLNEYFSLQISEEGELCAIPLLLKGYLPALAKLPRFLLRLGPFVDWSCEEGCFRTFLRELAAFYTPEQLPVLGREVPAEKGVGASAVADGDEDEDAYVTARRAQVMRMLEYVVFPAMRARLVATSRLLRGVVEVADLKGLYRVFERC